MYVFDINELQQWHKQHREQKWMKNEVDQREKKKFM